MPKSRIHNQIRIAMMSLTLGPTRKAGLRDGI